MKAAREYVHDLAGIDVKDGNVERIEGRGGAATLRVRNLYLHSRYNPEQEAARLIDSANLDPARPVLVAGLGLGYHVAELLRRSFEVAVLEPDAVVARLALDEGLCSQDFLLGIGDPEEMAVSETFQSFARKSPQVLLHPPTARLYPEYAEAVSACVSKAALGALHLNVCVVGPLFGGSEPIAGYLADAFRNLGHNTQLVTNAEGWPLYEQVTKSVENGQVSGQLGEMFTNLLTEWTFARVAEFNPEICVVMAQAPVGKTFPLRLAKRGIVSAFWYVENWRHLPYWQQIAPYYDAFFHIQPGEFERKLEEAGCRHHAFVQTGCDPNRHRPVSLSPDEAEAFSCDLSFAGAGYFNRIEFFKGLTDFDFKLWGVGWGDRQLAPLVEGGERRFDSEDFMKIVAGSKINLNLHSSTAQEGVDPKCDAINPRVFEIAAAGGFQICDPAVGLERHFDFESELPVYRSLRECRDLIQHFLRHPEEREEIAGRAKERVLKEHTYEHRAQQMLDFIIERHGSRILRRGVRIQRTVGEMRGRAEEGSSLARWLIDLPEELPFTREALTALLPPRYAGMKPAEKLFAYMNEVVDFADTLLKEHR